MKKNISVNIFGTLYPIDEDAYELLQQYNENMRRYYSRMEDGDEIADDIEHRVAELLSELRSQGVMAITIEHVKEIITRIGDPQDLDDNDSNAADTTTAHNHNTSTHEETASGNHGSTGNTRTSGSTGNMGSNTNSANANDRGNSGRQLFRDPDDKILGGVLSGLSHYLGIKEPIVLRVLMIVFTITTFSSLALIYIIAWILIPEAITPEDRLRMHGKPVSAKAINEELMRGLNSANKFVHNPQHRDTARGCFSALMKFVLFCFWGFFFFILGCILLAVIAAIAGISIATLFGTADFITITGVEPDFFNMMQWIPRWLLYTVAITALLIVGLPLFGLIRLISNKKSNYTTATNVLLVVAWVISLGICIGASARIARVTQQKYHEYDKSRNTRNGIYLPGYEWEVLKRLGWKAEQLKGTQRGLEGWGTLPNGEYGRYIALKTEDDPNEMVYDLRHKQTLQPGRYQIEGYVRADGEGHALYALTNNSNDTMRVEIPTYYSPANEISDEEVVVDGSDGAREWSHVKGTFELKEAGDVLFGVSNVKGLSNAPWNSRDIDIAEVKVTRDE